MPLSEFLFVDSYPKIDSANSHYKDYTELVNSLGNLTLFHNFVAGLICHYSYYDDKGNILTPETEPWYRRLDDIEANGANFRVPEPLIYKLETDYTLQHTFAILFGYVIGLRQDIIDYYANPNWTYEYEVYTYLDLVLRRGYSLTTLTSWLGKGNHFKRDYKRFLKEY
jgi:hypothetical protein